MIRHLWTGERAALEKGWSSYESPSPSPRCDMPVCMSHSLSGKEPQVAVELTSPRGSSGVPASSAQAKPPKRGVSWGLSPRHRGLRPRPAGGMATKAKATDRGADQAASRANEATFGGGARIGPVGVAAAGSCVDLDSLVAEASIGGNAPQRPLPPSETQGSTMRSPLGPTPSKVDGSDDESDEE